MNRLADLLKIRPGEGRLAALLIGVMLATMMGSSLGGNGIEALFFARFGVEFLPYMYMALGLTTLLTTLAITALLGRVAHERLYVLLPAILAGLLIGGRALLALNVSWAYPVLWLGKEVLNTVIALFSWGLAGLVCDTRQAKRLFPLFGAGRILGSVLGGLSTQPLVNWLSTENLLLTWAGAMLIAFVLTQVLLRQRLREAPVRASRRSRKGHQANAFQAFITEVQQGYQFVRRSPLMRWVSAAAVLFSVLYFSIALPFSKAATAQFPNEEALAGFLGLFQGLSTAVAFLASLFIANRLFARFGIVNAILAFPAIYFVGFGAIMSVAAFPVIVAFRFAQMVWLSGIADSAYQVLFNVVPAERRDQVRAFIGGVPEQAGIVIAGAILVIGEQALQPQQLYLIGLIAAGLTLAVFWRIKGAYGRALADALRGGQPQLFISEEEPFGGFRRDAEAVRAAVAGISDPNPVLRRVSAEILGSLSVPEATRALVNTLQDPEASVRAASVRALVCARATPALLDIAACLRDPEPEVRVQAVEALRQLAGYAPGLSANLRPLFDDPDPLVRTRVALALLMASPPTPSPERTLRVSRSGEGVAEQGVRAEARALLRNMVVVGDLAARVSALKALGEWGDAEAFELVCMELEDRPAPPAVRRAAAIALARIDPVRAIQYLIRALDDEDRSVRSAVARALELIGSPALEPTLAALSNPALERGALLALQRLPAQSSANAVRAYAEASVRWALHYHDLQQAVQTEHTPGPAGEALQLLSDALRDKARYHGLNALHAVGLLRERDTVAVAMEGLRSRDAARRANALETLDTIGEPAIIKPLLRVWESGEPAASGDGAISKHLPRLLEDPDAWIRACAVLVARNSLSAEADHPLRVTLVRLAETDLDASVRATATLALNGDSLMDTLPTLSLMERILFLRRVPLFTDLSPADLKQVAGIASEQFFTNGDVIAEQGEPGEEMYIIVAGEVSVQMEEAEKARRKPGDVVGEMAIISQEPRIASLIAVGDVRTLCISRQQFEGLLRERPETSLAVMRVLCQRLKEAMN